jgi:phage baseplate assembly protein W|tara:strand:+ start:2098 stop:2493 length:396 start_codon:yes stop_codon:yes gene_type:complete
MNGIGPKLPLQRDDVYGNYTLISSYAEEIKQNFKNLLLTAPGERMMNPDFGVGLRNFLFEPEQRVSGMIRQRITNQASKYMPFIRINKILFNHGIDPKDSVDSNVLSIIIEFDVPSMNLQTDIQIQAEDVN